VIDGFTFAFGEAGTDPVPLYLHACGHTTGFPERIVCFRCSRICNVDAELQRIERATIEAGDLDFLRDLKIGGSNDEA
jgi:hypothetical protein